MTVKPQKAVRVVMDGLRFGFDLTYSGRFPMFDYFDHVNNPFAAGMGGHNEQGMLCTGEFEVRAGPNKGSRRRLNSYSTATTPGLTGSPRRANGSGKPSSDTGTTGLRCRRIGCTSTPTAD
ncbi:MAG: hypothetical protein QGH42_07530 [Kiritimatiellia bacterium]|nr:hypothetical protein [Kiritimatiellia bacterium]